MPSAAAELVLNTSCPLCYDEGKENALRNRAGVFGTYCVGADGASRPHVFDDTGTLRLLLKKMEEKKELAARRNAPTPVQPQTLPVEDETPISTVEPKAFEVTDVDAARLSELLDQPIIDCGTLVGAVFAMKNDTSVALTEDTRKLIAKSDIKQRADGGLALQVFVPWKGKVDRKSPTSQNPGWALVDKAVFNGVAPSQYAQDLFENIASGNYFPPGDLPLYPEVDVRTEGYWLLINVPELYVGSMVERAQEVGIDAQQFLQSYFFWMIDNELFP